MPKPAEHPFRKELRELTMVPELVCPQEVMEILRCKPTRLERLRKANVDHDPPFPVTVHECACCPPMWRKSEIVAFQKVDAVKRAHDRHLRRRAKIEATPAGTYDV